MAAVCRSCTMAIGALLLCSAALAIGACQDDDEPAPMASGAWLAIPPRQESAALRLVHPSSGFERAVGEPARYRNASWSPGGALVAAVRAGDAPEVVIFDSRDEREPISVPVEDADVRIAWSPDATRLAVYRPGGALLLGAEGEVITRLAAPEGAALTNVAGRGEWDEEGRFFAAPAGGFLLVMERNGAAAFIDPDTFVRYPGETRELVVTDWGEDGLVAIFVRSGEERASQFIVDVTAEPPEVVSSSDFEGNAGPYDGLLAQARDRADSPVILGRHAAPATLRWVVALPGADATAPAIWYRTDEDFEQLPGDFVLRADAEWIAENVGMLYLDPPEMPGAQ